MLTALGILAALLALQLIYPFVTVLAAQARPYRIPAPSPGVADKMPDFACIVTAYRNSEIAKPLLGSLLRQKYPNWTAYLVADECPEFGFSFSDERIVLLQPESPLRLKAKSIMYAWEHFRRPHDYVVIFDADNVAHPDFLNELLPFLRAGFVCAQGQRKAKNTDTDYAALDSLGEHYKNHIEREVPYRLGGSAVISGSGMATRSDVYRAYLDSPEIQQGQHLWKKMLQEDKILQNFLLRRGHRIAYARNAVIYDEKVQTGAAVETQRGRWLYSYFQNVPNALGLLGRSLANGSGNQAYFGLVTLALPMFLQVAAGLAIAAVAFFVLPWACAALLVALAVFSANIFWVLWLDGAPPAVWRAAWKAPYFVFRQAFSLFKMRDPNKFFKHTEHQKTVDLDEIINPKEPHNVKITKK
jgi:cellulose synthase/poly-beta-1,6-N-acetylglucosamine synthase-like glycosyltransferase